jgi:mycothiol synthase
VETGVHVTLRPPRLEDVAEIAAFASELQRAYGSGGMSEAQIRDRLTSRQRKPEENYCLAEVDGRIVGWTTSWYPDESSDRIFIDVAAHPRDEAVLEQLLEWGEERARRFGAGRTIRMHAGAAEGNEVLAELLRRHGFELVRHFFRMEIELDEEPAQPVWPRGIAVRTYQPGDERAVYDADIEAFRDHWDSFSVPFEEWREHFLGSSEFDPGLWFLAEDHDELAGIALCWSERRPGAGYINVLGVRRPWRRRGLATALLLHSFHEFRRRGRAKVDLNVDGENLTGAVRLYERAGMRVAHREDAYRKEVR